jgi:hypothetical protein
LVLFSYQLIYCRLTKDVYHTTKVLLLLNAGKEKDVKGKNLADIEIEQDLMHYDEKDNIEKNSMDQVLKMIIQKKTTMRIQLLLLRLLNPLLQ